MRKATITTFGQAVLNGRLMEGAAIEIKDSSFAEDYYEVYLDGKYIETLHYLCIEEIE